MTTVFPGSLDTYTDKVDGVDNVLAAHVNDMQDAIEEIEVHLQTKGMMTRVRNTSGATVAANDVGYLDEAGEFKTTTTANLIVPWAVVISGAANNSDIIVCRRGRITVKLNANCSAGDYLYTSTTTGQASVLAYLTPEVFAVAITANTGGAGGTCEALLLTQRYTHSLTGTYDMVFFESVSTTDWLTTQNGAPVGAVVTYNVALTSGSEDVIVPQSANELGKLVLHNTTQGEEAFIQSVNIGANEITVTAAADLTNWEDTDVLSVRSQTNTQAIGASYYFDVKLVSTEIPALAVGMHVNWVIRDTGGIQTLVTHPWESYVAAKDYAASGQVVNISFRTFAPVPIINRRYCIRWLASGAGTARFLQRVFEVVVAEP